MKFRKIKIYSIIIFGLFIVSNYASIIGNENLNSLSIENDVITDDSLDHNMIIEYDYLLNFDILDKYSDKIIKDIENKRINNQEGTKNTIYVDDDGGADYTKIQDAINNANSGDTIFVYSGIYYENIWVDKNINLVGEDRDNTIIDGGGSGDVAMLVYLNNVDFDGFTIRNSGTNTYDMGIVVYSCSYCTISNCKITNENSHGMLITEYSNNNIITNCVISNNGRQGLLINGVSNDNQISNCIAQYNNWTGICNAVSSRNIFSDCITSNNLYCGFHIYNCSDEYSDNEIHNCEISDNYDYGVYFYFSDDNFINNCNIYPNHLVGIRLYYSNTNMIYNSDISDNDYGISGQVSNDNVIKSCNLFSNGYGISLPFSDFNNISYCEIEENDYGIRGYFSDNNLVFNCNLTSNNNIGITLNNSNNNIIYHNNFNYNAQNAYDNSSNVWDNGFPSGGNYWDDYTGTDSNGDGIGESPYPIAGGNNEDEYPLMQPYGDQPWYFIHITDTHVGTTNAIPRFVKVLNEIDNKYSNAKFVVVSGDLVHWGSGNTGTTDFNFFKWAMNQYLSIPWYTCPGNHDYYFLEQGIDNYKNIIDTRLNYEEFINNIHLISFDTAPDFDFWEGFLDADELPEGNGLYQEGIDLINNIKIYNPNTKKVIIQHHPTYYPNQGDWDNEFYWSDGSFQHHREEFIDFCRDYNVKVVLSGHTHGRYMSYDDTGYAPPSNSGWLTEGADNVGGYWSTEKLVQQGHKTPFYVGTGACSQYLRYRRIGVDGGDIHVYPEETATASDEWLNEYRYEMDIWNAPVLKNENGTSRTCNLHLYNETGGHVGINETGVIECELLDAYYEDDTLYNNSFGNITSGEIINILCKENDTLTWEIEGIIDGNLTIEGCFINQDYQINSIYEDIPFFNTSVGYIYVGDDRFEEHILHIDDDGDNISDREIEPNDIFYPPDKPNKPIGDLIVFTNQTSNYKSSTTDLNNDSLFYIFDWGDGNISSLLGPYLSGENVSANHIWKQPGEYKIRIKAIDNTSRISKWSENLTINVYSILIDSNQSTFNRGFPIRHASDGDWAGAQDFLPTLSTFTKGEIYLRKFGTPEFNLTVELRTDGPQGTLIDTLTFSPDEIPTSWTWLEIDFSDVTVIPGTQYFIVCPPAPIGVTTSFGYEWGYAFGNQYNDGSFWFTRDGGGLWRDLPTMYEFVFRTYGYS